MRNLGIEREITQEAFQELAATGALVTGENVSPIEIAKDILEDTRRQIGEDVTEAEFNEFLESM